MRFSSALSKDLPALLALYHDATRHMDERGVFQWDEIYPDETVLRDDIRRGQMSIGRVGGRIAVAFSLEYGGEGDYEPAEWRYPADRFAVLHRLCVHPDFQGRGVAREAMDHIEKRARGQGAQALRLDAFTQNPSALRLYERRGYEKAGEIRYRKGLFYLYEKRL